MPLVFAAAHGAGKEPDNLAGRYTFNWKTAPLPKKCVKIDDKRLAEFRSKAYACGSTEKSESASGEPFVQCTKTDDAAEYLIFKTAASCEKERRTQESNSDE